MTGSWGGPISRRGPAGWSPSASWRGWLDAIRAHPWRWARPSFRFAIPQWVAKSAATLDQLTEGRFTLVLAPGNWPDEFAAMGRDFDSRGAALETGFWSLREIWSAGAGDGGPSPRPWSPGGPPVWLAGARATMLRAIRLGVPFQASRIGPADLAPVAREWFDKGGTKLAVRVRMGVGRSGPGAGLIPAGRHRHRRPDRAGVLPRRAGRRVP